MALKNPTGLEQSEPQQSEIGNELVSTSKEKEPEESYGRTLPSDLVPSSLNSSMDVQYNKNRSRQKQNPADYSIMKAADQSSLFGGNSFFVNQPPLIHAKPKSKMLLRKMKKGSREGSQYLHPQSRNGPDVK